MAQTDVPPQSWDEFFQDFTRLHHGWLVTVGVIDTDLLLREAEVRAHVVSDEEPLEEIRPLADGEDLAIVTGQGDGRITHYVRHPTRLMLDRSSQGADESLRIDDETGRSTLIHFRSAVVPETLDGLAPAER